MANVRLSIPAAPRPSRNGYDPDNETAFRREVERVLAEIDVALTQSVENAAALINVKDHGALGDGTTDDTTAIETAAAAALNGVLFFPAGTYSVTGVTLDEKLTVLAAQGATIKLANSADVPVIDITAAGVLWQGGKIDANRANQTSTAEANCIRVTADDVTIADVEALASTHYAIYGKNVDNFRVVRCSATDTRLSGIAAEKLTAGDATNIFIASNSIDRSGESNPALLHGITVAAASGSFINEVRILGNHALMPTVSADTPVGIETTFCNRCTVAGNTTVDGYFGISVADGQEVSVSHNTAYNADEAGIEMAGCDHSVVQGNVVDGNNLSTKGIIISKSGTSGDYNNVSVFANSVKDFTLRGVTVEIGGTYVSVSDNTILAGTTAASKCIFVDRGSSHIAIKGNTCDGNDEATQCINLVRCEYVAIEGNILANTDTAASGRGIVFTDDGTGGGVSPDHITVTGNVFEGHSSAGDIGTSLSGGGAIGDDIKVFANIGEHISSQANYYDFLNNIMDHFGSGTPESSLTAGIGSTFRRTDGGAGTSFYVKESGTGNTGWVAK